MERKVFFGRYRISTNVDGSPREVSRSGAAIIYKAIDAETNMPVQVHLISMSILDQARCEQFKQRAETAQKLNHANIAKIFKVGLDHDDLILVSEYLEGETLDSWVVAHGPMPPDAVMRVGLQVVRAIKAAAYLNLTHRAIQPSNIKIVPGESADGGWPLVKVLNFGIAGIELHSRSSEGSELAPASSPQFASPEQLLNREIDFHSEMYSLGATMCFLLTGATPLAVDGMKARLRLRRLPELRRAPKALRGVLVHLLRENPKNRPQDPVAFEQELRECLRKIEWRQRMGEQTRRLFGTLIPRRSELTKEPAMPRTQGWRHIAAVAVLLLAGVAIGAFLSGLFRHGDRSGVAIGVPNAETYAAPPVQTAGAAAAAVPTAAPAVATLPSQNPSPAVAAATQPAPDVQAAQPVDASMSETSPNRALQSNSTEIASADETREPEPPVAVTNEESSSAASSETATGSTAESSRSRSRRETTSNSSNSTRKLSPETAEPDGPSSDQEPIVKKALPVTPEQSPVVRKAGEEGAVFQSPAGQTVIVEPAEAASAVVPAPSPTPQREIYIQRPGSLIPMRKPAHTPEPEPHD